MSKKKINWTDEQREVINSRNSNLLVSASAGSGKTAVMIERIASLIEENADVSEMVVVTFTNLAAAEMKERLAERLAENRQNPRVLEQLEKIDSASICTLHSFCNELLRNYFYVVDIDPSFAILDDATVAMLKRNALDEVLQQYFAQKDDQAFKQVYKIFASGRKESNFKQTLLDLYNFSRCLEDFDRWYEEKRANYARFSDDNPFVKVLLNDVAQSVAYWQANLPDVAARAAEEQLDYADVLQYNADVVSKLQITTFTQTLNDLCTLQLQDLPDKKKNVPFTDFEEQIRDHYKSIRKDVAGVIEKYSKLYRGESVDKLWEEMQRTVDYTDKLVEMLHKFEEIFVEAKKQRGGVDYDDLEHLCLKLLDDEATLKEIRARYKLIFVDEYQDTNPVQEAIIRKLADGDNLFMVGDIKQSIYGFRGCEPSIFLGKYDKYAQRDGGTLIKLNDNFRSNSEVLNFVNDVFNRLMTLGFGKVDYQANAQLKGSNPKSLQTFSTRVDYLVEPETKKGELTEMYDIAAPFDAKPKISQGELIAKRIKEYVGMVYYDKDDEAKRKPKRIEYGDIVILMRSLTNKAIDIYNTLARYNIPVAANFKVDGLATKEVRDLINLLRVLDNPYVDVSFVGSALTVFGGFTESELGHVRLECDGRDVPMLTRMQQYVESAKKDDLGGKISKFLDFLQEIRFYSRSASVDEIALKVLEKTNYHLYVQGLPNGALRIKKLYAFIDGLKGATYAQSVDKFLAFIDETENKRPAEGIGQTNAVRLMTMHASKGLEFPVVIVAGMETPIQFDYDSVEKCFDLGLATRYYNFDNMRKADTLSLAACRLFDCNKQREEELRLMYVAMTRAKFALDVVATVSKKQLQSLPKLPTKAASMLDWLYLATQSMMTTDTLTHGLQIEEHKEIVQDESKPSPLSLKCKQDNNAKAIEEKISYVYHKIGEIEMPSKIVSSALDKEYVDKTDEEQSEQTNPSEHVLNVNNDRNLVGTAYHKVLQYAPFGASVEQIVQTVDELAASGKIEQRFAEQIDVQLVYDTLHNPQLLALIEGGEIHHEIPFMLNVKYSDVAKDKRFSDEVMLQGVIDLLIVKQTKAVVVDFKYTGRSDLVEERYTAQLNSYKLAVERICGITDVETYVLSIADGKLIKI